jgi:hypothetical protein
MRIYFVMFFVLFAFKVKSQNQNLETPKSLNWNKGAEGNEMTFKLIVSPDTGSIARSYTIKQGKLFGMEIDSLGNFKWNPPFHLVERHEQNKIVQIIVETLENNKTPISKNIDLIITHTNRPVVINELKTFYVQFNTKNAYRIDNITVYDEDNDQVVFIPNLETFPEGMALSSNGEISWEPSLSQFRKIKEKPLYIEFYAQDQPAKSQSKIKLKIEATQLDLAPEITIVPKKDRFELKENENVSLRFYLSDPNGEEDIETFDFLSNIPNFDKKTLVKNSSNQYEFIWTPGYSFVQDPADSLNFHVDFFVLDKSQKREVKRIYFTVENTLNEAETDKKNYNLYLGTMTRAWELSEQLKEKEEELKKAYNRARKGKKHRSVVNASLGATTGLSSIFSKNKPDAQRLISTIGGTTVLTISTLEATEVIGKSMKDLIDRLNYVIEKKNEIQTKGDIFARDFSLKSNRRESDFLKKIDDFMSTMNLKGLVALELNAAWEAKNKATENNITKTFKDFTAW